MLDPASVASVEATVRAVATASRTLRLYPPGSPIPRQALDAAVAPLSALLSGQTALTLSVAREGFECMGTPVAGTIGGAAELADLLRSHGVAEIAFMAGCGVDDLLGLLTLLTRAPEDVRAEGGVSPALATVGVASIRVTTVSLTVTMTIDEPAEGEDVDAFFRDLGADAVKLTSWLAAATAGDPATLSEGLGELADAAGVDGLDRFLEAFAKAFMSQETDGRDTLLGLGIEPGRARDLIGGMLSELPATDVSESLTGGLYGKNMLSLSTALSKLPLGVRLDEVIADVRASLPALGRSEHEVEFLDHMIEVRNSPDPEKPLADVDPTYREIAAASQVDEDTLAASRSEAKASGAQVNVKSVFTMLKLLDQQNDFALYVKGLDRLAAMVPRLVRQGDLGLAAGILKEIAERESRPSQPWPELTGRLRAAMAVATARPTMAALLDAILASPEAEKHVRDALLFADDSGRTAFLEEALSREGEAPFQVVEQLLGRRIVDLLAVAAPRVRSAQLVLVARRLASDGGTHSMQALETVARRPEEAARTSVAEGLAGTTNPSAARLLTTLLNDASPKVAVAAARALSRTDMPGAADAVAAKLSDLDIDGKDFALGRDMIGCLAQMPGPAAAQALRRVAERKAIIKRGRFLEVQKLARDALAVQSQRGAG